jgi:hypothetical protein
LGSEHDVDVSTKNVETARGDSDVDISTKKVETVRGEWGSKVGK